MTVPLAQAARQDIGPPASPACPALEGAWLAVPVLPEQAFLGGAPPAVSSTRAFSLTFLSSFLADNSSIMIIEGSATTRRRITYYIHRAEVAAPNARDQAGYRAEESCEEWSGTLSLQRWTNEGRGECLWLHGRCSCCCSSGGSKVLMAVGRKRLQVQVIENGGMESCKIYIEAGDVEIVAGGCAALLPCSSCDQLVALVSGIRYTPNSPVAAGPCAAKPSGAREQQPPGALGSAGGGGKGRGVGGGGARRFAFYRYPTSGFSFRKQEGRPSPHSVGDLARPLQLRHIYPRP